MHKLLRKLKKTKGFTYIELIVTIAMMVVMTLAYAVNYSGISTRSKVNMAANKLVSDIRLAQSYSLNAKTHGGTLPEGGWGLNFDHANPNEYIIFADTDVTPAVRMHVYNNPGSENFKTVDLVSGVEIEGVNLDGSSYNIVNICFDPPDPDIYFCRQNGNLCGSNSVEIILSDDTGTYTKRVIANKAGLAEAID